MSTSPEYKAALAAVKVASQAFAEVTRRYRAREIGDAEYLAARLAHDYAEADFDEAYTREEAREPPADPAAMSPQETLEL